MKSNEQRHADCNEEKAELLKPLGFSYRGNGIFYHKLTDRCFDFSAFGVEGIATKIFVDGFKTGERDLKEKILDLVD